MRALVYLGPGRMELQELPDPAPGPGEALVQVKAAAICGSDLHGYREASPRRIPPLVMGHEVSGVVAALGEGTDASLLGRRVIVEPVVSCGSCPRCLEGSPNLCPDRRLMGMSFPGGFAEVCVVPAGQLNPIPDGLPSEVACLVEPLANALHVVQRSVLRTDSVLVIGAGSIGLFCVRGSVLAGAREVLVADPILARIALAEAQGGQGVPPDRPESTVAELTAGLGVDVVIDAAGFPTTWALALETVRFGGTIAVIGLGRPEGPVSYHTLVSKGVVIIGSYACTHADFDRAIDLLLAGDVVTDPWVTRWALMDGQAAFQALIDGAEVKVVLVP